MGERGIQLIRDIKFLGASPIFVVRISPTSKLASQQASEPASQQGSNGAIAKTQMEQHGPPAGTSHSSSSSSRDQTGWSSSSSSSRDQPQQEQRQQGPDRLEQLLPWAFSGLSNLYSRNTKCKLSDAGKNHTPPRAQDKL